MNKIIEPISIILRVTLGMSFMLNGISQINGASLSHIGDFFVKFIPQAYEAIYYIGLTEFVLGLFLLFGIFTGLTAALAIVWNIALVIANPLFFINPLAAITQMNQIAAQIGISMVVFSIGAPALSFDRFFFPFKNKISVKKAYMLENSLAYSLGLTLALSFASIFLFISDQNYVIFDQWKQLGDAVPIINMPIIGAFLAVGAVLLFLGYGRRQVAFTALILYLLVSLSAFDKNFETLALIGATLSLSIMPSRPIKALKMIPRRKPEEL